MNMPVAIVGTRGSLLAVAQAEFLVKHLESKGFRVDWKRYTTSGDQWLNGPLDESRGSGFFTKELEDALADGTVDLLIHSLKDVSLERPQGVQIACIPSREDCSDWLVMRKDAPKACVIGTSSVRRERMLKATFPDAAFTWIRGNVPTRVQRVRDGEMRGEALHGTVLAAAGLRRLDLDLSDLEVRALTPEELLPAPGQGALLAETRGDRTDLIAALADLHDPLTARCVKLERALLAGVGGGCQQPLGALAQKVEDGRIRLRGAFASDAGIQRGEAVGEDDAALVSSVLKQMGLS
ncbi:MAG: hydroxymethylbilane synthase [Holophagaceae bacterium]|nr:hydroxymethylbilane synthase [Holophagaceae bacterium]